MFKNLIFVPIFFGCGSYLESTTKIKTPGWSNLSQNIEIINKYELSTITNIIYTEWSKEFDFKSESDENILFNNISNLKIIWVDEIPVDLRYFPENTKIFALTESPRTVLIDLNYQKKFVYLFTHEFVHVALWSINKNSDPDHENKEYKGWDDTHNEWIRKTELFIEKYLIFNEENF